MRKDRILLIRQKQERLIRKMRGCGVRQKDIYELMGIERELTTEWLEDSTRACMERLLKGGTADA